MWNEDSEWLPTRLSPPYAMVAGYYSHLPRHVTLACDRKDRMLPTVHRARPEPSHSPVSPLLLMAPYMLVHPATMDINSLWCQSRPITVFIEQHLIALQPINQVLLSCKCKPSVALNGRRVFPPTCISDLETQLTLTRPLFLPINAATPPASVMASRRAAWI